MTFELTPYGAALTGIDAVSAYPDVEPKPKPRKPITMPVDLPVTDARIGMPYGNRQGVIFDIRPLGRKDRTHVEFVVKTGSVKNHYRHEMIGTFETRVTV